MIYVPIVKNRQHEMQVLKDLNQYFSSDIIPLIEIIKDEYEEQYAMDSSTGKYLYEVKPGNKIKTRVKLPKDDKYIITLSEINKTISSKKAFIDYFRFIEDEYPKVKIDLESVKLSLRLRADRSFYKEKLKEVLAYNNFIPVISIKSNFLYSNQEFSDLIDMFQARNSAMAIRITADLFDKYKDIIKLKLRKMDYLLFDIREQRVDSRFLELTEIQELELDNNTILLNSPRKKEIRNNQYEEKDYTILIDNSALVKYKLYNLKGVGDFGGLKDTLPENQAGGNGKGAALALLFVHNKNQFLSLMNKDTNLGTGGYIAIKKEIARLETILDPKGKCPGIKKIKSINKGSWGTWNYITLARYIYQIYELQNI